MRYALLVLVAAGVVRCSTSKADTPRTFSCSPAAFISSPQPDAAYCDDGATVCVVTATALSCFKK